MSITNSIHVVSFKKNDKRDDFNFEIVNFPSLDRDILALARVYSNVIVSKCRNPFLTVK